MTSRTTTNTAKASIVGWIGLGSMGNAMAQRIQKRLTAQNSTEPLRYWNRTLSRGQAIKSLGGKQCDSITQLVTECDLIVISASDDTAVLSITDQIIASPSIRGKIVIDTTTVHPDTTRDLAARFRLAGAEFAAAPVFGATPAAEAGQLLIAFAGADEVYDAVSPLLKGVIAREVLVVGNEAEKAVLLKTTGNFLMAGLMELIAEAHVFAEKTGLPAAMLEKLLELNFGNVAHSDSIRMTTGVYRPGKNEAPWSGLDLALKDVGHGVDCAEKNGVDLKVGKLALENLKAAKIWTDENGGRALDSTSLYGVVRMGSGLDFETEFVKKRDTSQ